MAEAEHVTPYGTHPEYLPAFITGRQDEDARQVEQLDHAASRALEALSLNRFPAKGAGLDWDSAAYTNQRWWDDEAGWGRLMADLLSSAVARGERVAVFWGNLAVPTVVMPADVAVRHAQEFLEVAPVFWVHPLGGSVLIECQMDGQVTVADIPSA
ncbi:hypothetical protein [Streptomyces sp. NPDC049915]|uniref:hypothetical protein n=1 Tax=Streptomyces sp. NPDC049915 TaxID=3155510 RepID=UPI0034214CD1